jgi:hypothetical protein
LVGGFCLLNGCIVFVQTSRGLCGATHVAKDRTHGGDDGGEHRDLVGKAVAMAFSRMFKFVVVWAVDVKTVFRHLDDPS